jgi:hypothetical protein
MRLLPQIFGVEAEVGIWMKNFGRREPLLNETSKALPRDPAFLAAAL